MLMYFSSYTEVPLRTWVIFICFLSINIKLFNKKLCNPFFLFITAMCNVNFWCNYTCRSLVYSLQTSWWKRIYFTISFFFFFCHIAKVCLKFTWQLDGNMAKDIERYEIFIVKTFLAISSNPTFRLFSSGSCVCLQSNSDPRRMNNTLRPKYVIVCVLPVWVRDLSWRLVEIAQ